MDSSSESEIDGYSDLEHIVVQLKKLSQLNIGKVVQIIKTYEPEIVKDPEEFKINFSILKNNTIQVIKSFMKSIDDKTVKKRIRKTKKIKKVEVRVKNSQECNESSRIVQSSDKNVIVLSSEPSDGVILISSSDTNWYIGC